MFWRQCLLVFVVSIVVDIIASLHTRSIVGGNILWASSTVLFSWYLTLWNFTQFENNHGLKKFLIVTAIGLGAAVGSAVVILLDT